MASTIESELGPGTTESGPLVVPRQALLPRHVRIGVIAGVIAIALPLLGKHALRSHVDTKLAKVASSRLGVDVSIASARVGLTGTLELANVQLGEALSLQKVIARVAPSTSTKQGLNSNELLLIAPSLRLEVAADGSSNLDNLLNTLRRQDDAGHSSSESESKRTSRITRIRIEQGRASIKHPLGQSQTENIHAVLSKTDLHLVAGVTDFDLDHDSKTIRGVFPRMAVDYTRGQGLKRFVASNGAADLRSTLGNAVFRSITASFGIAERGWELHSEVGRERSEGALAITGSQTIDGKTMSIEGSLLPSSLLQFLSIPGMDFRKGTLSGNANVRLSKSVDIDYDLQVEDLRFLSSHLAQRPVQLTANALGSLSAQLGPVKRYFEARIKSFELGAMRGEGSISGDWQAGEALPSAAKLDLAMQSMPCDAALNSLPLSLRTSLAGLELRGDIASSLSIYVSGNNPDDSHLCVESGIEGCKAVREPPGANTKKLTRSYEHRMPDGTPTLLTQGAEGFISFDDLPSFVPRAFAAAEDARFFRHRGFDVHQIERSMAINVANKSMLRGGSTISQQLVKNLFLSRKRSLARKFQEAVLTWRLEKNTSKERILELYLNIIELGDQNTYGITAASRRWFGIEPTELSILQTAFLAAITPEPTTMSRRIRDSGKLDSLSKSRVGIILRAMRRAKVISVREYEKASRQELRFASSALATNSALATDKSSL